MSSTSLRVCTSCAISDIANQAHFVRWTSYEKLTWQSKEESTLARWQRHARLSSLWIRSGPGYSVRKRASNVIGTGAWRWNRSISSTRRTYKYFYSTLEFFAIHRSLYSIQKTSHRFVIALIAVHLRTISLTLSSHKACKSIADWRQHIARGHQVADIRLEVFIVGSFMFVLLEVADPILQRRANLERTEKSIRVSNASKQESYLPYL